MASEILLLVGTRPEAIKLLPVQRALAARGARAAVLATGQHRELLRPLLATLELPVDEELDVLEPGQSLTALSSRLLAALEEPLRRRRPTVLVVQGDTTSVVMGALAAFHEGVPVAHVEAGLRTGDLANPFPEEANRRLVATLARLHCAPTERARRHLLSEGVAEADVHVVGNTVVDALLDVRARVLPRLPPDPALQPLLESPHPLLLVTAHRRESFGPDLQQVARALARLADQFAGRLEIAYPLHPNPNVEGPMRRELAGRPGLHLLPPLQYPRFLQLLARAHLVLTDSGGVQEEAAALGVPLLVARHVSERPEALECGVGELVGPDAERIVAAAGRLLRDPAEHARRARPAAVFGDGHAGERIADLLLQRFGT